MVSSIFIYNIPQLEPQHGFQVLEAKKLLIHNTIEKDAISRHHKSLYITLHTPRTQASTWVSFLEIPLLPTLNLAIILARWVRKPTGSAMRTTAIVIGTTSETIKAAGAM